MDHAYCQYAGGHEIIVPTDSHLSLVLSLFISLMSLP